MPRAPKATPEQDRADYLGVRHTSPDFIRQLRGGLDLGVDPEVYRRRFAAQVKREPEGPRRNMARAALGALRHLLRDPAAGVVRWTHSGQYVWREDDPPVKELTILRSRSINGGAGGQGRLPGF